MGASAPGSRTEVLIPSSGHLIPLRGIGGGMGIRTPDLLIANETLYQLSYTPNSFKLSKLHGDLRSDKDARLYRHEIMGNYYAKKKIRSKMETNALRSAAALSLHRKLVSRNASGSFESGKTSFEPRERSSRSSASPSVADLFASSSCFQQRRTRRL